MPLSFDAASSGPYLAAFSPQYSSGSNNNISNIEWSEADSQGQKNVTLWEWYDVHPTKGFPISITDFSGSFKKA